MRSEPQRAVDVEPEPGPEPEPDWPRQALRSVAAETIGFLRAAWQATIAPRRFCAGWADGSIPALNPVACTVNAVGLTMLWLVVCQRVLQSDLKIPWWTDLAAWALQIVSVAIGGSVLHLPLRWVGGARRWRTTIGALLYITSGPFTLMRLVLAPPLVLATGRGHVPALSLLAVATLPPTLAYYVLAMMGAHRLSLGRTTLAIAIWLVLFMALGILATALLHLQPHGRHA